MTGQEHERLLRRVVELQERANETGLAQRVAVEAEFANAQAHRASVEAELAHAQKHRDAVRAEMTTIRDDFAKAALTGLLADDGRGGAWEDYAKDAYKIADAMLAARTKAIP